MKILRVRRGFTTNSSGANEYLPSPSGSGSASASPTPAPAEEALVCNGPAQATGTASVEANVPAAVAAQPGGGWTVGIVGAGVVMLFAAERAIRSVFRRKNGHSHDDAPTDAPE